MFLKRFLKRVCFVVPMALANILDDLVFLFSLNYARGPFLAFRFSKWWLTKGFGQY